ncbi:unnamed protein product [Rhodiola kirilowii]
MASHALLQLNQLYPPLTSSSFHHKPTISVSINFPSYCNRKLSISSSYSSNALRHKLDEDEEDEEEEEPVIGDCLVFEEGVFEDPYLEDDFEPVRKEPRAAAAAAVVVEPENLVPEKWKEAQDAINITKKERRLIAQQAQFGVRLERKRKGLVPLRNAVLEEAYVALRNEKLAQLNPVVLDNPSFSEEGEKVDEEEEKGGDEGFGGRVKPKNPKWAVYGRSMNDISEFFNSGDYVPGDAAANQAPRKLFSKEEKYLLNKRVPDLDSATSDNWLPLHSLASSGDFNLMTALLKHNVDINAVDKGGLTALHKAITCKKQAITNCLLRESANPFICDNDGASLMHYAVRTASSHTIKILLLYNVDINLQDKDGWTPLHLAVQGRRTDLVRLLLIKGADKSIKNQDGLTPLDLCLYFGRDTRTYELIKLLKQPQHR